MQKKEYGIKDLRGRIVITLLDENGQPAQVSEELPYVVFDENLDEVEEGSTKSHKIVLETSDGSKVAFVSLKGKFYDVKVEEV
jgi:hypothetical protein